MNVHKRVLFSYAYKKKVLTLDPIACWPLNEISGTTVNDIVGGYNGSYNGTTLNQLAMPGVTMGYAGTQDGINDRCDMYSASLASLQSYRNEGTITGWYRLTTSSGTRGIFRFAASSGFDIQIYYSLGEIDFFRTGSSGGSKMSYFEVSTINQWIAFACTWSVTNNTTQTYINTVSGVAGTGIVAASTGDTLNTRTQIASLSATSSYFSGQLAWLTLFNRALTPSEIGILSKAV